jgi:hypothetical protein
MSDGKIISTSQFKVKKLAIVTKLGPVDVSSIFEELNIFDSIFTPCITGNIVIRDSNGLTNKFSFDGSEVLIVEMGKTDSDATFRKSFRIYKQTERQSINLTSEAYILHFVSEEFIISQQSKISQSFRDTYSNVVKKIFSDNLGIRDNMICYMEESEGIRKILIPNMKPFDAIKFCATRALNKKQSPTFLFFENKVGYNFVTLSSLLADSPSHYINFNIKNFGQNSNELMGAIKYEVISQFDLNKNITSGLYASTFMGFDYITKNFAVKAINYDSLYGTSEHANKTPNIGIVTNKFGLKNTEMYDSRVVFSPMNAFYSDSSYIKENDPESIDIQDDPYNYRVQREASIRSILNQRVKVLMPGNFDLTSGLTADLQIPVRGQNTIGNNDTDYSLSGKYIITASRQMITYQKHETIIELGTDSNNRKNVYQSSELQNSLMDSYA